MPQICRLRFSRCEKMAYGKPRGLIPDLSKAGLMFVQKNTCRFTGRQVLPCACNWDSEDQSNKHDHIVRERDFFIHPAILRIRQFISKRRPVTRNVLVEGWS